MDSKLFNSPFEMKLRILLLLSAESKKAMSMDRILALDFISCYSADFSLPYGNLHGQNNFRYGEIASRRMLVQEAIKPLVRQGLVSVTVEDGYLFSISDEGKKYAQEMKEAYATQYKEIAKAVIKKYRKDSDKDIMDEIQQYSTKALRV